MVRILLHGCCGRMGHMITETAAKDKEIEIAAGVDAFGSAYSSYPVYASLDEVKEAFDVVVDFSTAKAVDALLDWCAAGGHPVVVCTTGLSAEQTEKLQKAAQKTAVLKSANMSVGINLLLNVLSGVAPKLIEAGYDCEIVERHHNQKLDAPSGTAIALADAVSDSLEEPLDYVYDRSGRRQARPHTEIGISAVRGGTIVGDHDIIFAGQDEVITFSHTAYSRALFATGAITAAKFLAGKDAGFYTMQDALA